MAKKGQIDTLDTKKRLLVALEKSLGVVSEACKTAKVSRATFYNYCNEDPLFKAAVDAMEDVALDFAESALHRQIKNDVPSSTIFFLKTKGKRRGYIERHEHTGPDGQALIPEKITIEIISDAPPVTSEEDIKDPTE